MVLTRSSSKMSVEMPGTTSSGTCGVNTLTSVTTTESTRILTSDTATTYTLRDNPILSESVQDLSSVSGEDAEQTIISPIFQSATAQNIRTEIRDSILLNRATEGPAPMSNIQQMVEASIGICQTRLMREMDEKIQRALLDIKQTLALHQNTSQARDNTINPGVSSSRVTFQSEQATYSITQPPVGLRPSAVTAEVNRNLQQSQPLGQIPPLIPAPNYTNTSNNCQELDTNVEPPQAVLHASPTLQRQQAPLVTGQQIFHSETPRQTDESHQNRFASNPPRYQIPQQRTGLQQHDVWQPAIQATPLQQQHMLSQNRLPSQQSPSMSNFYQQPENEQSNYPQDNWSASAFHPTMPQQNCHMAMNVPNYYEPPNRFKLAKWGLKFDGTNKTLNVQEFIFRVGALRRDYNCTDNEILRDFHLLLEGPALDWYWDYRKFVNINTWEELEKALLAQYRRYQMEHQIQMKILNRRQQMQETFDDFFNAVVKLRNQQQYPYDEAQRSLTDFCREARRAESLISNQRQLYQQRSNFPQRVSELEYGDDISLVELEVDGLRSAPNYTCFNCKVVGHSFVDCPKPVTRIFCFRCGRENVVTPHCPHCQGNRARNPPRTGQARSTDV